MSGWSTLGAALAGPATEGPMATALRSARTEEALARAAIERDKMLAQRSLAGANPAAFTPEQQVATMVGGLGSDYSGVMRGRNLGQEFDLRADIADPATDMAGRQYAAQAIAGKPVNYLDSMGNGSYADIRDPAAGVQQTPLGDALISQHTNQADAAAALAAERREPKPPGKGPMSLDDFDIRERVKRLNGVIYSTDPLVTNDMREAARNELAATISPEDQLGDPTDVDTTATDETNKGTEGPGLFDRLVGSVTGFFSDDDTQAAPAAEPAAENLPAPKSPEEMNALKPGTVFIAPDGSRRVKP